MSRLAKQPINIPDNTEVQLKDGELSVKGLKGTLSIKVRPEIIFNIGDKSVNLKPKNEAELTKALLGTYYSHLSNMIEGVTKGFEKKLIIDGVGYKAQSKGKDIELSLGFSHPIVVKAEEGIEFKVEKNTIIVSGISKEKVGNVASSIRKLKKPEPYKGKGIHYDGEIIRRKVGKKVAGTT